MEIEYEATFPNIIKDEIRNKLIELGAKLIKKEFLMKRSVFTLPKNNEIDNAWLRVRDESDRITMSLKVIDGNQIHNQKEVCLNIDHFSDAELFLTTLGCKKKAYQETKRELWILDEVEVCIDEWPFLEPFVEVEGKSEELVKLVSEKLGFDYTKALFCSVATLYNIKYGVDEDIISNATPIITFEKNPFL
ncbi:CYTH domain-containing protein [archaeon]|jgi:adenylate cyclase, class 2|nr:CYTH domain-containing protein [archaeon]MBT3730929.1 CYTH domain-containing protein [archaeon]MBT4669832.1 CYTH domain-containing protein [archaeon]MBT5029984.1 CYTH domain-containing protein [archaeon]MBT5288085.1 CYTH domain-containing protein [archaeon]